MNRAALLACALALVGSACVVDEARNKGARCKVGDDCVTGSCYRGFCVEGAPDAGLDAALDASDGGDRVDSEEGGDAHMNIDGETDLGVDGGTDLGVDWGTDLGVDGGTDLGADTGPLCVPACTAPRPDCCFTGCVDFMRDDANCGSCGRPCVGSDKCTSGICCQPPAVNCNGTCTTLGTNTDCASCGDACTGLGITCCHPSGGGAPMCKLGTLCL